MYGRWFLRGVRKALSVPVLILASSFIGFAGLAMESGMTLPQTVFMTALVWALPANVVLIGAILAGNTLPAAALAVALSSVRLTPMVVSLMPEMRTPHTRPWVLYLLSHLVAVTSWVLAMGAFPSVPRDMRTAYYGGLGSTLLVVNTTVVAVTFVVAGNLPPLIMAGLFFLTPIYFLTSLWGSSRERAGSWAMIFGLVLGPILHVFIPGMALLATGLVGGTAAYLLHRWEKARGRT